VIAGELAQTLVVTAVALGAVGLIVRRAIARKRRQMQTPGCAHCPSAGSDRGQTGVKPGSDRGQTRVKPLV
jgi:hypothetical protein